MKEVSEKVTHAVPVMEHFYTLQGEGFHSGRAAYFIRLGGCDVGCVWCDVKESWEAEKHPLTECSQLVNLVKNSGCGFAVITGGEPAMYDLRYLTEELKKQGIETAIETSGVYNLTGTWDWICFSPKKFKAPVSSIYRQCNELKVIVYHKSDLEWAGEHAAKVNAGCQLYLQPEWSKRELVLPLIIDYIKQNPKWKISLQTHKYMNIP